MPEQAFQKTVREYYKLHARHDLPWRQPEPDGTFDPYKIMVSELMLQQTQVARVIPKYHEFLAKFPTISTLAEAPLAEVLRAWSGLGYNRRAKFLHEAAQQLVREYQGVFPQSILELKQLPGIGANTAGAIVAYAFNQPVVFIETNIRTVFIHHFFHDQTDIADRAIIELVEQTLDRQNPRDWYWALMDYGSYLKQTVGSLNQQSRQYTKQSKFQGSKRQIRGQVIRLLGDSSYTRAELQTAVNDKRLDTVLQELLDEHLILKRGNSFCL